jgi:hypothetical protein
MSDRIVVLFGSAGSGKSTVAEMIRQLLPGAEVFGFADPIKAFARDVFGFDERVLYGPSAEREVSVWAGAYALTQFRKLAPDFVEGWANCMPQRLSALRLVQWYTSTYDIVEALSQDKLVTARHVLQTLGTELGRDLLDPSLWLHIAAKRAHQSKAPAVVVSDGRFRNELEWGDENGRTVMIQNPFEVKILGAHQSERDLAGEPLRSFDYVIRNDKTAGLDALRREVRDMLELWGWIDSEDKRNG